MEKKDDNMSDKPVFVCITCTCKNCEFSTFDKSNVSGTCKHPSAYDSDMVIGVNANDFCSHNRLRTKP